MPPTTTPGGLMKKYGNKLVTAVTKHANDETDFGFQRLPPGINNGVAQLSECYFDIYKSGPSKDEYYFRAVGVVQSPETVIVDGGEMVVRGLTTSIMIPVCDTTTQAGKVTTQEEHVAEILNEMRKLGGDEFTKGAKGTDLEALAATLAKAKPFFKFTTSVRKGMKKPDGTMGADGVWENWFGNKGLENYVPSEGTGTVDETAQTQTAGGGAHQPPTTAIAATPEEPHGEVDLAALVEAANNKDPNARKKLTELAIAAGNDPKAVEAANSWEDVKTMIEAASTGGDASDDQTAGEWIPQVTEQYKYKPPVKGPGGKIMPAKTAVDVEVTAVDIAKKLLSLKLVSNPKTTYANVPWDALESGE